MKIKKTNNLKKEIKINDLFEIVGGGTPSSSNIEYYKNGNIPWVGPADMDFSTKYISKGKSNITKLGLDKSSAKIVPKNSILLSIRAPVGKVSLADNEITTNQGIKSLITKTNDSYNYLYYVIKNNKSKFERYSDGTTFLELNTKTLKNLKIDIISDINQQEKIAQVLSQQEEQVNNIQKLIEKLEKRNQYYAERLLSGELRVREDEEGNIEFYENEEWKEVDFNLKKKNIPIDWEVDKINNIIKTQKGSSVKSEDFNHEGKGLQYLRTNEIWEDSSKNKEPVFFNGSLNNIITKNKSEYIVCFDGYNNKPFEGTLGMVTNNGVGICSGELHKILSIKNISEYYVNVMLLKNYRFQEIICRYAEGSSVQHAGKHFKKIDEVLIPIKDQLILNKIFKEQLEEIDKLKLLKEKEKKRFEWLSDALLSGEYQIVD